MEEEQKKQEESQENTEEKVEESKEEPKVESDEPSEEKAEAKPEETSEEKPGEKKPIKSELATVIKKEERSAHLKQIEEKLLAQGGPIEELEEPQKLVEEAPASKGSMDEVKDDIFDIYEEETPKKTTRRRKIKLEQIPDAPKSEKLAKENPEVQTIKERIIAVRDTLLTLKWDYDRGQINPAKKVKYEKLKKEVEVLEEQLKMISE